MARGAMRALDLPEMEAPHLGVSSGGVEVEGIVFVRATSPSSGRQLGRCGRGRYCFRVCWPYRKWKPLIWASAQEGWKWKVLAVHALIVLPAPAAFRFHPARADAGCRVSTSSHEAFSFHRPRAGAGWAASASSCRPGRPLGHRGLGRDRLAGRSIRRPRGSALGLLLLFLLAHDWRVAEGKQVGIQVRSQD